MSFLESDKATFKTATELSFEKALKEANNESYDKAIKEPYKNLLESLNAKKIEELSVNKDEIKSHLKSEIVKRYYYKKGEYINKVFNDKHITKAVTILKDDKKYSRILK